MKKKIAILMLTIVLASIFFGSGMYVGAATKNGAGSQNDPVVSLSYLDYRLKELEDKYASAGNKGSADISGNSENKGFEKITLSRGERFIPGEGGVIVLYSGACTAVGKGLADLTNARIITEGNSIPAYSQMLVPDASSGVVASDAVVLFAVRGS